MKLIAFHAAFEPGETVYRKVSDDPIRGIVTGIQIDISGGVIFRVAWGTAQPTETWHYAGELTREFAPHFKGVPKE